LSRKNEIFLKKFFVMAKKNVFRILPAQMHGTTKTILEDFTILTDASAHPIAISEYLETVFPNVEEVIPIDVALGKTPVDVRAGGDAAVNEDGSDGDTGTAKIEPVAYLAFVGADIGFTTELGINLSFLSGCNDEIHQLLELLIVEL
jgi:hypothetical protein